MRHFRLIVLLALLIFRFQQDVYGQGVGGDYFAGGGSSLPPDFFLVNIANISFTTINIIYFSKEVIKDREGASMILSGLGGLVAYYAGSRMLSEGYQDAGTITIFIGLATHFSGVMNLAGRISDKKKRKAKLALVR